jgi:hypothetical protein
VPIVCRVSNSSKTALCHCGHSGDSFAASSVFSSSSSVLLSSCPDRNAIAIFVVASFDFCFADEDAIGLVTSSGSYWSRRAGHAFGLFNVQ